MAPLLSPFPLRTNEQPDSKGGGELVCERVDVRCGCNVHPLRIVGKMSSRP